MFHALQAHSGKFGVKALALSFLHQKGCTVQFLQSFQGIFLFIDGWTLYIHGQNITLLHRFYIKPQVITGFTFVATNTLGCRGANSGGTWEPSSQKVFGLA